MDYVEMKNLIEDLKEERIGLKQKLKRRENKIREMERSGPDADLLKANIQLSNELSDLKEDMEAMKTKYREEAL